MCDVCSTQQKAILYSHSRSATHRPNLRNKVPKTDPSVCVCPFTSPTDKYHKKVFKLGPGGSTISAFLDMFCPFGSNQPLISGGGESAGMGEAKGGGAARPTPRGGPTMAPSSARKRPPGPGARAAPAALHPGCCPPPPAPPGCCPGSPAAMGGWGRPPREPARWRGGGRAHRRTQQLVLALTPDQCGAHD